MTTNAATTSSGSVAGNDLQGRQPGDGDCWNHIGVSGDRSCPELNTFIHCRNCPVYRRGRPDLLRPPRARGIPGRVVPVAGRLGGPGCSRGETRRGGRRRPSDRWRGGQRPDLPARGGMAGLPHPGCRRGHHAPARAPDPPPLQPGPRGIGEPARPGSTLRLAARLAGRRQHRGVDRGWSCCATATGPRPGPSRPMRSWESIACRAASGAVSPRRWSIRPSGSVRRSCPGMSGASACSTNSGSLRPCGVSGIEQRSEQLLDDGALPHGGGDPHRHAVGGPGGAGGGVGLARGDRAAHAGGPLAQRGGADRRSRRRGAGGPCDGRLLRRGAEGEARPSIGACRHPASGRGPPGPGRAARRVRSWSPGSPSTPTRSMRWSPT